MIVDFPVSLLVLNVNKDVEVKVVPDSREIVRSNERLRRKLGPV